MEHDRADRSSHGPYRTAEPPAIVCRPRCAACERVRPPTDRIEVSMHAELARGERRARLERVLAFVAIAIALFIFFWALGTAAQESRRVEGGARESGDGPPAHLGDAHAAGATAAREADTDLDPTRLLASALRRAVAVNDGRSPVAHCRNAGPAAPGGGRWARCGARMRAFARLFVEAGAIHEIDPWLLAAMASRESGLNPWAEGGAGELGVMQLHPRGFGHSIVAHLARDRERCERRVDACQRPVIDRAAAHLRRALERCGGNEACALSIYNTGRPDSDAGLAYARRVLSRREQLRTWAAESNGGDDS